MFRLLVVGRSIGGITTILPSGRTICVPPLTVFVCDGECTSDCGKYSHIYKSTHKEDNHSAEASKISNIPAVQIFHLPPTNLKFLRLSSNTHAKRTTTTQNKITKTTTHKSKGGFHYITIRFNYDDLSFGKIKYIYIDIYLLQFTRQTLT